MGGTLPLDFSRRKHDPSANKLLKEVLEGLRYKTLPLAFPMGTYFEEFFGYHRKIYQAFRRRNGQAAENAIRRHNQRMIEIIRTTPWGSEDDFDAKGGP